MSGHGKGGKRLGKGGTKRHKKVMQDNITKLDSHRLAQRGSVKLVSGFIFQESQGVLKVFLENAIHDAVTYMEHAKCKTVTTMDVVYSAMHQGCTVYGFGGSTKVGKNPTVYQ
ncbi:PREDICTED: histone H4-like [Gavialis gangeticus]|uniref:histone H4-like n=1 Tax=Gavialis gangeticus TaxID=94835 RepID=UPI00092F2A6E|nr:PREDICTED: histone H4-like [Gavialis gangeticus]